MSRDAELWAWTIEREHGATAFLHAAMRIDELDAQGEREVACVWRGVLERLERLEADPGRRH